MICYLQHFRFECDNCSVSSQLTKLFEHTRRFRYKNKISTSVTTTAAAIPKLMIPLVSKAAGKKTNEIANVRIITEEY